MPLIFRQLVEYGQHVLGTCIVNKLMTTTKYMYMTVLVARCFPANSIINCKLHVEYQLFINSFTNKLNNFMGETVNL